jgi:predicted metal-binding protein
MPNTLKTYPAPWEGRLILACKKCQKKVKGNHDLRALAKLKKTIKKQNELHSGEKLQVISVPCMDLCPKNGVTVCNLLEPRQLSILRSEGDIGRLY